MKGKVDEERWSCIADEGGEIEMLCGRLRTWGNSSSLWQREEHRKYSPLGLQLQFISHKNNKEDSNVPIKIIYTAVIKHYDIDISTKYGGEKLGVLANVSTQIVIQNIQYKKMFSDGVSSGKAFCFLWIYVNIKTNWMNYWECLGKCVTSFMNIILKPCCSHWLNP